MNLNPTALVFWATCAGVGYLVNGAHGAVVGLVGSLAISLLAAFIPTRRR